MERRGLNLTVGCAVHGTPQFPDIHLGMWQVRMTGEPFTQARIDAFHELVLRLNCLHLEEGERLPSYNPKHSHGDVTLDVVMPGVTGHLIDYCPDGKWAVFEAPRQFPGITFGVGYDYAFIEGEWSAEGLDALDYAGLSSVWTGEDLDGSRPEQPRCLTLTQQLLATQLARAMVHSFTTAPLENMAKEPVSLVA